MKKILIFIWLSIFMQCQTQKRDTLKIPLVNDSFEKFNIKDFENNAVRGSRVLKNQNQLILEDIQSYGFIRQIYQQNIFCFNYLFYKSGNIKEKGIGFIKGASIGVWYHFDEDGKLIKEENTDEAYAFTPEDIIKYCKKNNIELSKGYHEGDGYQTSVYKNELDGKKVWLLSYIISLNKQEKEVKLTLDGQTGKVIKREEFPYDSY
ncbi:hypothetical protein VUJ46_13785 [Chryseobacterium sp. MYb264]|uniref:hypothetical protein n=1 Tax=Chryseobacterium sp. MYb264 TaxID=2745153 RepID=UPI002E0FB31F|nr:hypothetical protein VUJ46_13785 [Chryseobacterium sp. MYb264]